MKIKRNPCEASEANRWMLQSKIEIKASRVMFKKRGRGSIMKMRLLTAEVKKKQEAEI